MEYMIINGFNTSTIPNCVVTDFGEVEAAKPKVSETATLFGVNGNYRVLVLMRVMNEHLHFTFQGR